ncbi:MAG: hypothetical protein HBSAPP02_02070 [Phycisphaerae bacterium]|nr:MAG: glycosyltransferase [Planctomycetia bacterium]GJQ25175.1 MAG: hypothetical protein HBSAPP02_02070 [Phycisphaerae bacterium]
MTDRTSQPGRRRVLLLSYHYPPMGGSGVQRAAFLARHLCALGWDVHVLRAGHRHHPLRDETLAEHDGALPGPVVHDVFGWDSGGAAAKLARWIPVAGPRTWVEDRIYWRLDRWQRRSCGAEPQQWWAGAAIRAAVRLARSAPLDAVISTSPPHSVHRAAMGIARRLAVPWIADLRDPITDNFAYQPRSIAEHERWVALERDIVSRAAAVVVTCEDLRDHLLARHRRGHAIQVIPNGYDEASCEKHGANRDGSMASLTRPGGSTSLCITSVGSFYRDQSVGLLLSALRRVNAGASEPGVRWRIVGSVSGQQEQLFEPDDSRFVERVGYVSHGEALDAMRRADLLFLMTPANAGGALCIPSKTFEYLASGRHVLGVVHAGTHLERILRSAGNTTLVLHGGGAADDLVRALEACRSRFIAGQLQTPRDTTFVNRFTRRAVAMQFSSLLEAVKDRSGMNATAAARELTRTRSHNPEGAPASQSSRTQDRGAKR